MHLSEGVLDVSLCAAGYAGAAGLVFYSLRKTETDAISRVSVMGAVFFVSSLIHFKVGVTSVHLTMTGLAGVLLGPSCVLAIVAGLFFQAVMFQHGGLSTLGVNTVVFSLAALFASFCFRFCLRLTGYTRRWIGAFSGFFSGVGVVTGALLAMSIIFLSGREFAGVAYLFSAAHMVLALVEGAVTALVMLQIFAIKPEMVLQDNLKPQTNTAAVSNDLK